MTTKTSKWNSTVAGQIAGLIGVGRADIGRGWVLDGPGAARFGWYRRTPVGAQKWLGRTLANVRSAYYRGDANVAHAQS